MKPANDNRREGPTVSAWALIVIAGVVGFGGIVLSLL